MCSLAAYERSSLSSLRNVTIKGRHTISDGDALHAAVLDVLGIEKFLPGWWRMS